MAQPADPQGVADDPRRWLAATPVIDLEDPKVRLRVHSLTQLCSSDRDKAVALYRFVKRLPIGKPFRLHTRTARQVFDAGRGDAPDKVTLLVAMLRIAGVPARVRYITLRGEVFRGLHTRLREANRPLLELWIDGAWQQTDTYIHDATTMAAARQRLKEQGWTWGYGIHVDGRMLWDGSGSSYAIGVPDAQHPMVVRDLGAFDDPSQFVASRAYRDRHLPLVRLLRWNMLAPFTDRAWKRLREEVPRAPHASRTPS